MKGAFHFACEYWLFCLLEHCAVPVCISYDMDVIDEHRIDVICDELRGSGIDIDIETLTFYIDDVYRKHGALYREIVTRVCVDDFSAIWEAIHPNSFGHIVSFLSMVYTIDISDECRRVAVREVVPLLKTIYIGGYREYANRRRLGRWGRFSNAMSVLVPFHTWRMFRGVGGVIYTCGLYVVAICALMLWM